MKNSVLWSVNFHVVCEIFLLSMSFAIISWTFLDFGYKQLSMSKKNTGRSSRSCIDPIIIGRDCLT